MFCGRNLNNRINSLHEEAPRIVYNGSESTFPKLPELNNSVSIHHRNICLLATELYKMKNSVSMNEWNYNVNSLLIWSMLNYALLHLTHITCLGALFSLVPPASLCLTWFCALHVSHTAFKRLTYVPHLRHLRALLMSFHCTPSDVIKFPIETNFKIF